MLKLMLLIVNIADKLMIGDVWGWERWIFRVNSYYSTTDDLMDTYYQIEIWIHDLEIMKLTATSPKHHLLEVRND
jgi:hypothetical protein